MRERYRIGHAGTADVDGVVGSAHHGLSPREFIPLRRFATPYASSIDGAGAVTLTDFFGDPIVHGLVRLAAPGDAQTPMPGLVTGHWTSPGPTPVSATSWSLVSLATLSGPAPRRPTTGRRGIPSHLRSPISA
jgi:hypothetical protein